MICVGTIVRVGIGGRERNVREATGDINGFHNILLSIQIEFFIIFKFSTCY